MNYKETKERLKKLNLKKTKLTNEIAALTDEVTTLTAERSKIYNKIKDFTVDHTTAKNGASELGALTTQIKSKERSIKTKDKNLVICILDIERLEA